MKRLIFDLDGTICETKNGNYSDSAPRKGIKDLLRDYSDRGFSIVINTSRSMRTYDGNLGKITAYTVPLIIDWLRKHEIPFDEIHIGKPWCGFDGFYIDDKAIRPSEFMKLNYEEIIELLRLEE